MDAGTDELFKRVAKKLGWIEKGGLDLAEKELMKTFGKSRRPAVGSAGALEALDSDSSTSGKENHCLKGHRPTAILLDSSDDDDFDCFLLEKTTPRNAAHHALRPFEKNTPHEKSSPALVVSSDSDDSFEKFLSRVKTPKTKVADVRKSGSDDSLKQFIVDDVTSDEDFVTDQRKKKPVTKGHLKTPKPDERAPLAGRCPVPQWESPVFASDEDEGLVIKSTWKSRHTMRGPQPMEPKSLTPGSLAPPSSSAYQTPLHLDDSSSGEDFQSLVERLKKKNHSVGNSSRTETPKASQSNVGL